MSDDLSPRTVANTVTELVTARLNSSDVCFIIQSNSMLPTLAPGDQVIVRRARAEDLRLGDIVMLQANDLWLTHRLIARRIENGKLMLITKGDNAASADRARDAADLVGVVVAVQREGYYMNFQSTPARIVNLLFVLSGRAPRFVQRVWARLARGRLLARRVLALVVIALAILLTLPLPRAWASVRITSFKAQREATQVRVTWTTATELNNIGFNVLRGPSANGPFTKMNAGLIPSQCIGCITGANYSYSDTTAVAGQTYYYKLQCVDTGSKTQDFPPVSVGTGAATATPTGVSATATKSPSIAPSPTPRPSSTSASNTSASVSVQPSATSPARTATNDPSQPAAAVPVTPLTKVAIAVPTGKPTAAQPAAGAPAPQPSVPAARVTVSVDDTVEEPPEEESPEDAAPPSSSTGARSALATLATLGLAGILGGGALVLAAFAFILFARTTREE